MAEPASPTAELAKATAPPAPEPIGPTPQADAGGMGNAMFGMLADGGFVAKLGSGLRLGAEQLKSAEGVDLSGLPQPLPGVRLTRAKWEAPRKRLKVDANLAVPHLDAAEVTIYASKEGKPSFSVPKLQKQLQVPALGNPKVTLSLSEEGVFGGSVTVGATNLTPPGLRTLKVTGGGTLTIQNGLFSGSVDATLAYASLGSGEVHLTFSEAGSISGNGSLRVKPPFLNEINATLALDEGGNLNGAVIVAMTESKSPIPALSLTGGTLEVKYANGVVSGSLTEFRAAYRDLADLTATASIASGAFSGEGKLVLTVPGLNEANGQVKVRSGIVSGTMTLASDAFPKALPVKSGRITATLSESGSIGFSGTVAVELGPAGSGKLAAAYSETGQFSIAATINVTVPGLQGAQVSVAYVNGDLSGEAQVPIDPAVVPGLTGNAVVRYQQGLWSGETEIAFSADNGKLAGRIRVTVAQTEAGTLQLGGTGELEAQIAPRLRGTLTATILPEGGVDVSGRIVVTEPLELFPEKTFDKELFKYSQNIPLWAILVAVIRVRAGVRGGIGAGVFRNIVVEGSYTIGSEAADPTFSISGEMFIPAFIEAYVAFGAGLGLDVVIGSLTGGIEGVATAGIYGAISVVPELSYADGDWSIEGDATLAAGARLKVGLNAWAEVEAFWVTVWEETWKLGEWVWNIGPDLSLNAHMAYSFGQPGPPEVEFNASDIDSASMIQEAMPKDGPAPSGAKEALQNKAEWKGKLKEQKPAPLPPEIAAQSQAPPPTPPAPAKQPKPKSPAPAAPAPGQAAPGQAPGQAPPAGAAAPPPGSPAADKNAAAAAAPDASAKGAVPASEVPTADKARYPAPITLATLDEPPAIVPRTADQQQEDVDAAKKALELAIKSSEDSDTLDDYFPRIKQRFRLVDLGYVGDFDKGIHIEGGINPPIMITNLDEKVEGTGITAATRGEWKTDITHRSGKISATTVGLEMIADPLGPDHKLGSKAGGQTTLMDDLPTDPKTVPQGLEMFIRGHLLNADLGGAGDDFNQFPITRGANSNHSAKVEEQVKEVVNDRKFWVAYKVTITGTDRLVDLKTTNKATGRPYKAVDSVLDAEASYITLNKKRISFAKIRVESKYDPSEYAAGQSTDIAPASTRPDAQTADLSLVPAQSTVAEDLAAVPQLVNKPDEDAGIFPESMRTALAKAHQRHKIAGTQERIASVQGIGQERVDALYAAYEEARKNPAGPNGRDISALPKATLTQFSVVKGKWNDILVKIA